MTRTEGLAPLRDRDRAYRGDEEVNAGMVSRYETAAIEERDSRRRCEIRISSTGGIGLADSRQAMSDCIRFDGSVRPARAESEV